MTFKAENIEDFKALFNANRSHIAGFEGCSHVELLQDQSNPCIFFTYSNWENEASVENYRQSELFARVWSATKTLFNDKPEAWTIKEITFE